MGRGGTREEEEMTERGEHDGVGCGSSKRVHVFEGGEVTAVAFALCRYPTSEWALIGEFRASDVRTVQTFPLTETVYAKYIKV